MSQVWEPEVHFTQKRNLTYPSYRKINSRSDSSTLKLHCLVVSRESMINIMWKMTTTEQRDKKKPLDLTMWSVVVKYISILDTWTKSPTRNTAKWTLFPKPWSTLQDETMLETGIPNRRGSACPCSPWPQAHPHWQTVGQPYYYNIRIHAKSVTSV